MTITVPMELKVESALSAAIIDLLLRETEYLDRQQWEEWLELFTEDTVFWVPSWKNEQETIEDPTREVSLMYYEGRERLEERVWRLRSGQSPASVPLPRTVHVISNIRVQPDGPDEAVAHTVWTVHQYHPKRKTQTVFFGRADYRLCLSAGIWRIARKTVMLANDFIPSVLDFYSL
jgi:3-phenylpropionate/cinnamic acid dioxygenase small subunit